MKLKPGHPNFDIALDLEVGDRVRLIARTQPRAGQVVAVVREEDDPYKCLPAGFRPPECGFGRPRQVRSYLVKIDGEGRTAFWPKLSTLSVEAPR